MGVIFDRQLIKLDFSKNEKWLVLIFNFGKFGIVSGKMSRIVEFSRLTAIADYI